MAKRIADSQITRETLRNDSDEEEVEFSSNGPTRASDDVMRKRRIAQPRKKKAMIGSGNGESAMANSFGHSSLSNGKPLSQAGFSFSNSTTAPESVNNDLNAKLKALNTQFRDKVVEYISKDPFVDLSSVLDKYKSYITSINKRDHNGSAAQNDDSNVAHADEKKKPETIKVDSNSDSDSDDEVKVQGPVFTLNSKPTTNNPVFSFGPKKKRQADSSDSESEVEVKGPQFKVSSEISVSSGPFSLKKSEEKSVSEPTGQVASTNEETVEKPKFSFGNASAVGKAPATPAFSFGATSAVGSNAPTSGFNKNPIAPAFSFGSTKPEDEKNPASAPVPTPAFTFGKTATGDKAEEKKTPTFSFNSENISKPGFAIASTDGKNDESSKPVFSFDSKPSQNSTENSKSAGFTFGVQSNQAQATTSVPKTPFTFGSSFSTEKKNNSESQSSVTADAPAGSTNTDGAKQPFSFSATSAETSSSPFSFGASGKKDDSDKASKPTFNFGSSNSSTAPSFSFGKQSESKDNKSGGFKFSLPFAPVTSAAKETESKDAPTSEKIQEIHDDQENTEEDSQPIGLTNGEEDESVLFSKRAKLMVVNPETKGYDSRGVGELKLLQKKDDPSKIRILCRSDGMGHILLNTSIVKSFQYVPADAEKENFLKCPVINAEGKLETYIIRVKQKADGRQLCKAIADAQKLI